MCIKHVNLKSPFLNIPMTVHYKGRILMFIVGMLSAINIYSVFFSHNYLSLANSFIGITGLLLYFLNKASYKKFIWLWVFAQTIVISHTIADSATGYTVSKPVLDCTQFLKLQFGITLHNKETTYGLYYNFVTIIYFSLFSYLMATPKTDSETHNNPTDSAENTDM